MNKCLFAVCLLVCLFVSLCLFVCPSVCLFVLRFVCLFVRLVVRLFVARLRWTCFVALAPHGPPNGEGAYLPTYLVMRPCLTPHVIGNELLPFMVPLKS